MINVEKNFNLVKTSYKEDDVIVLLKDLSDSMKEMSTEEREKAIQSGIHYSEMLPEEKAPSDEYMALYRSSMDICKRDVANAISIVAEKMYSNTTDKETKVPVIISLARAGIPVGILIKRRLKQKYGIDCKHYAISIIRDKGIDINAMNYIFSKEVVANKNTVKNFFFVDGWTGKGAIKTQLDEAVKQLAEDSTDKWGDLSDDLYVLADPANITSFCGTKTDYLLPSACLNSTVSGLTSRTILNKYINEEAGDFHGAVYFEKFKDIDISNEFIDEITKEFDDDNMLYIAFADDKTTGMDVVNRICKDFSIEDYKKVKPGIGETTRVLLRRVPWKVIINSSYKDAGFNPEDDPNLKHIILLCKEKNIPIEYYDLGKYYRVCGIIKELSADA